VELGALVKSDVRVLLLLERQRDQERIIIQLRLQLAATHITSWAPRGFRIF
jgi:hypothetical protein